LCSRRGGSHDLQKDEEHAGPKAAGACSMQRWGVRGVRASRASHLGTLCRVIHAGVAVGDLAGYALPDAVQPEAIAALRACRQQGGAAHEWRRSREHAIEAEGRKLTFRQDVLPLDLQSLQLGSAQGAQVPFAVRPK
jgi:hypothetical protein